MCAWGTNVEMELGGRTWGVDACIAPIIAALNAGGVPTIGSCCGHGKEPGSILLADGRELVVFAERRG